MSETTPQHKVNLFLIGCMRSGTTTLFDKLSSHPQIFNSPVKEIHHFNAPLPKELYRPDPGNSLKAVLSETDGSWLHSLQLTESKDYRQLFQGRTDQKWALDASPYYFHEPGVLDKIQAYNPNARILLIHRNPMDRIRSHYLMDLSLGRRRPGLDELLLHELALAQKGELPWYSYLNLSRLNPGLENWKDRFGDRLLLLRFEELLSDPKKQFNRICRHLEIENFEDDRLPHKNQSRVVRSKQLNRWLQNMPGRHIIRRILPKRQRHGMAQMISHNDRSKVQIGVDVKQQLQEFFSG